MSAIILLLLLCSVLEFTCAWALPQHPLVQRKSSKSIHVSSSQLFASKMSSIPYPRAAVSVAVRCEYEKEAYYLLVQRGSHPNKGRWSFPGGKMEIGETALQGGKRELLEETRFAEQHELRWHPDTIATHDSIMVTEDGTVDYHFLIAV